MAKSCKFAPKKVAKSCSTQYEKDFGNGRSRHDDCNDGGLFFGIQDAIGMSPVDYRLMLNRDF